ncbi:MAG: hypothetical protein ACJ74O_17775 [Frankiaceae bacterium]
MTRLEAQAAETERHMTLGYGLAMLGAFESADLATVCGLRAGVDPDLRAVMAGWVITFNNLAQARYARFMAGVGW